MRSPLIIFTIATLANLNVDARSLPTANQLLYQQRELTMFMHYSMCTYAPAGGCEQDTACRTNPPSLFNPTGLNTTQWLETAAKLGAKEVCLTAHHTGGFALWQTNVTDYGIKESPYKGGKGDIVKEFTDSCRQFGISPCLYFINAWDCWESGDSPDIYVGKQLAMLTELADGRYGHIDRFWFDQFGFSSSPGQSPRGSFPAAWSKVADHVRAVSPGTMMLPGPDGCINPGEGGEGSYPVYHYVNDTNMCSYPWMLPKAQQAASSPSPNGQIYVPYESDLSIQNPGDAWFYHEGHPFLNAGELWTHYLAVAGRGSHFILNVPPNRSGLIADGFVAAVTALGDAVQASFGAGSDVGSKTNISGPCSTFEVVVQATPALSSFDSVVLIESLDAGQFIVEYSLDIQGADGIWISNITTAGGKTVGEKLIDILPVGVGAGGGAVRFKCVNAIGGPSTKVSLSSISLHKVVPPPLEVKNGTLRSYYGAANTDTAPCAFRDGGSCATFTNAAYTLVRDEAIVVNTRHETDQDTKWAHLVYSVNVSDNGLADGINPKFAPPGYADESTMDTMVVWTKPGLGKVRLDSYYSVAKEDFWVVGSNASRTEAVARGYVFVGTLGYGLALPSHD